jgi:hypothetical protein
MSRHTTRVSIIVTRSLLRRLAPPRPGKTPLSLGQWAREAWNAVGGQLKSLAADLRAVRPISTVGPAAYASQRPRSPVAAVDSAITALGQRMRDPQDSVHGQQICPQLSVPAMVPGSVRDAC